jgi:Zn-dependent protease/CBS domain-containing protein
MRKGFGFRLGRLFGIDVHVDWSLLIIFWLIASSLALAQFPSWHPEWTPGHAWGTALAAALLFFASVLAHELSHAIVGRRHGMKVDRITLFVFGGVAELGGEPRHWRAELWMAIVGPITSLVLGIVFLWLARTLAGPMPLSPGEIESWASRLDTVPTLLWWLGNINLILAAFNMVPGFPLDGGRVLRAILWGITANLREATRWASMGGQAFAWLLIATGTLMILGVRVPVFGTGLIGGIWLMLIGWFLNNAALMSFRQIILQETLQEVPVRRLMQTDVTGVTPDLSVADFVEQYLLPRSQRAFPVLDGRRLVGLVCLRDAQKVNRAAWNTTRLGDIMTPVEKLVAVGPDTDALDALAALGRAGVNQAPVLEHGELRGILRREDLVKWLALYGNLRLPDGNVPGATQ